MEKIMKNIQIGKSYYVEDDDGEIGVVRFLCFIKREDLQDGGYHDVYVAEHKNVLCKVSSRRVLGEVTL